MEKIYLESPILKRLREKGPGYFCLQKARIISDADVEILPKWAVIRQWYENLEADPNCEWVHMALQSITNAVVYQERVYFAVTRKTLAMLFQNDKNWQDKNFGMKFSSYEYLLEEMVSSKFFEPHPENPRFKEQKKPRIFKVVDKTILSLMKPVPEEEQLSELIEFIDKKNQIKDDDNDEEIVGNHRGNHSGNHRGNHSGHTVVSNKKEETKKQAPSETVTVPMVKESERLDLKQLLAKEIPDELPRFKEIHSLAGKIASNCGVDISIARIFERHLTSRINGKPTTKQKDLIKKLTASLEREFEKFQVSDVQIKPAVKLAPRIVKSQEDEEQQSDDNTLKVLNNVFGRQNIKVLKSRLTQVDDDEEKQSIQKEIEFWESVV